MTKTGFKRIFTDNNEYTDCKGYEDMDLLAYTMQEFLYTSKVRNDEYDFRMNDHIKLYDFMTTVVYFLDKSQTEFGRSEIHELIKVIRQDDGSSQGKEKIEYQKDGIIITCASFELIMALLWATYIYAKYKFEFCESNSWKGTYNMLYEEMHEYSQYGEKSTKALLLILQADKALQVMTNYLVEKYGVEQESAEFQEEQLSQKEEPKQDDDHVVEEISLHDKVRLDLLLRLMEDNGANLTRHGNKMKAAQIMQSITGLPLQTCKNYCSNRDLNTSIHTEEVLKMNTILQALGMKIRL